MNRDISKPRIFKTFYPKLGIGYWRVSHMPKPYNLKDAPLWLAAHKFTQKLNSKISEDNFKRKQNGKNTQENNQEKIH